MLTIGELAKRTGLRTSALRYYEEQGLLQPAERTAAGYRLYTDDAEQTVRLIQRMQRLGFSLTEVKLLLNGMAAGGLTDETMLQTAETRYLLLEQELTALLVLRHELGLFWQDLHRKVTQQEPTAATDRLAQLVQQICGDPQTQAVRLFEWLLRKSGCVLATQLMHNDEGYLVIARGDGAFIFARLFLAFAEGQV